MAQLRHAFGPGEVAKLMAAEVGQPGVGRQPVDDQLLRRPGHHRLPAVGQIAQPRSAVDGRARVVAFVAQLYLPGMYADSQPDGRQRPPLQLERTLNRVTGARERQHEAVALALLDRPHPAMDGDEIIYRTISAGGGGR